MPMIIERGGSLLEVMLMKLSDCYIFIRKLCSRFSSIAQGNTNCDSSRGTKTNSICLVEYVLRPLTDFNYPQGRRTHERRVMPRFDNAPVYNTEGVQESLANFGFRRMEHSPSGPGLAPCDFCLFSAMK
jgi:hypothetical protein